MKNELQFFCADKHEIVLFDDNRYYSIIRLWLDDNRFVLGNVLSKHNNMRFDLTLPYAQAMEIIDKINELKNKEII